MKRDLLFVFFLCGALSPGEGEIIAQWDFNSSPPDGAASTGTLAPCVGGGSASHVGGTTAASSGEFASGDTHLDPAGSADNSGWNTAGYPAADADNKTAGVRFDIDTTGFEHISISWSQRNSATATRYLRLQYTLDGIRFNEADLITVPAENAFTNQTIDLSAIPGAADNPLFGFQLVAEFESTANGWGAESYVATKPGSTYGKSGTIRFDMVTVSGVPIPGANTPPTISAVSNQTIRTRHSTGALPFTVGDAEDAPENLLVSAVSSNPTVVPDTAIVLAGNGALRSVAVTASDQPGAATITLNVMDSGGRLASTSFDIDVLPENTPPSITGMSRANTFSGIPTPPIALVLSDCETPPGALSVSAASANPGLVPSDGFLFEGSGSNRTLIITPAPGRTGVTPITVTVSDGTNTTCSVFPLEVTASDSVLLDEPLEYAEGSLDTNSGGFWTTRSGIAGQCQVTNATLQITSSQTEDVVAPLLGAPWTKNNGTVLYASFKATFLNLPKLAPALFAHFADGSTLRGRIYAGTTNVTPGCFHLFTANGAGVPTEFPMDLDINTTYRLVERYDLDAATTTLWVNPASEFDTAVVAWDLQPAVPILSYGFRQDADLGATILIGDLKVALSFSDVLPSEVPAPIPLKIWFDGMFLQLNWDDPSFCLEAAPTLLGPYTDLTGAASPYFASPSSNAEFFRLRRR